jgi:type I site-specific restriction endonuclease
MHNTVPPNPLAADAKINEAIIDRYYQTRGVRRIGEAFEIDRDRKTLLMQATGGARRAWQSRCPICSCAATG